jgi:hypothetical protein
VIKLINDKIKNKENEFHVFLKIIACFAFLRPIFTMAFATQFELAGLNLLKLFGTGFSAIFIIIATSYAKRFRLDFTNLAIILYCFYCVLSFIWGSSLEGIAVQIFPFTVFFAIRAARLNYKQNLIILNCILLGYLIPIFGSAFFIATGRTLYETSFWTNLERYSGLYLKIHTMAHSMFLYIVSFSIFYYFYKNSEVKYKMLIYLYYGAGVLSIFNIYKSFTRTVYIGLYAYLMIYLVGLRRYLAVGISMILTLIVISQSTQIEIIFFDIYDYFAGRQPVETVGSGRIGLWEDSIQKFTEYDFERKFLGTGFGRGDIVHNDILALMSTSGIIGLILYLSILAGAFHKIFKSKRDRQIKIVYLAFVATVLLMNLVSNSYLSRFEAQQTFFFLLGIFFGLKDQQKLSNEDSIE